MFDHQETDNTVHLIPLLIVAPLACHQSLASEPEGSACVTKETVVAEFPYCIGQVYRPADEDMSVVVVNATSVVLRPDRLGEFQHYGSSPKVWLQSWANSTVPCHVRLLHPLQQGFREERWLFPPGGGSFPPQPSNGIVKARYFAREGQVDVMFAKEDELLHLSHDWVELNVVSESGKAFSVQTPDGPFLFLVPTNTEVTFRETEKGRLVVEWGSDSDI